MAAGFYTTPFPYVAKKLSAGSSHANPTDLQESFMDVTRAIRACIYAKMKVQPETCEVIPAGQNKEMDKEDLRKQRYVARFTRRCWQLVLDIERGGISGSSSTSTTPVINTYFFKWLNASTPEEEIYSNLLAIQAGEVLVKDLNKKAKALDDDDGEQPAAHELKWEGQKKMLEVQVEELTKQLQSEKNLNRENAKMHKQRITKMTTDAERLQKEVSNERATVTRLQTALRNRLSEIQSLKLDMEEQLRQRDEQLASLRKDNEDLKEELSKLKTQFIHRETALEEEEVNNHQSQKVEEQGENTAGNRKVKTTEKKELAQSTTTVTRNVEVAEGISLLMETEIFNAIPGETKKQDQESQESEELPSQGSDLSDDMDQSMDIDNLDNDIILGDENMEKETSFSCEGKVKMETESDEISTQTNATNEDKKDPGRPSGEKEKQGQQEKSEEWVAVSYGRDLKYIGRVVKEHKLTITVRFLERKADGYFQLRKRDEEAEKDLVFMRNVIVNKQGSSRYEVQHEKDIRKKHEDFWKTIRLKKKVESYWNIEENPDLSKVVCRVGGEEILLGDLKTVQQSMCHKEVEMMKEFSSRFVEVGWLNDKIVNASLKLLEASSRKMGQKVVAAESFVMEKISKTEEPLQLRSWKWMKKVDFTNQDLVLLPMCYASHWTLGVVNLKQKKLLHYDSKWEKQEKKTRSGELFFNCMRKMMAANDIDVTSWKDVSPTTPQQSDWQSCGVYAIKVAEFVVEGKEPSISQDEVSSLRLQIALKLLRNSR